MLRVYRAHHGAWQDLGAQLVTPGGDPLSVAAYGEHVYVAWTDVSAPTPRVLAADVTEGGWTMLDGIGADGSATHGAALSVDMLGIPHASWIEDGATSSGVVGRWTGTGWDTISAFAEAEAGAVDAPVAADMQLAGGAAPVVAWRDGEIVHVGLYNGEPGTFAKP
jgi:hypothetical protein